MTQEEINRAFEESFSEAERRAIAELDGPLVETVDDIIAEMCDARKVHNVQYGIQGGLSMNVCYPTSEVVRKYAERLRVAHMKERKEAGE